MTASQETGHRVAQSHYTSWPSPPDPGDLSRRVAQRRAELRLTRQQVASRAGISLRYLEYLERYPGRPTGVMLRQLAAALQTTPSVLLGAGRETPPGHGRLSQPGMLERIPPAECRRLILPGGIGRIGFPAASGIVMLPVNFAMVANTIVVRTGAGSLIGAHSDGEVSFEVDHIDEALEEAWSVLVQGHAHRVAQHAEVAAMQRRDRVRPWPGGDHDLCIRITPRRITGRRIVHRLDGRWDHRPIETRSNVSGERPHPAPF
jgi:transcriptional regulator with XRE-family HTH domain